MASPIFSAIVVAELPAMRNVSGGKSATPTAAPAAGGTAPPAGAGDKAPGQPRLMLALQPPAVPGQEPRPLPDGVLTFCFPDLQQLMKKPFHYDHSAEEFQFTLTSRDEFRVHGFCRRYRTGCPSAGGRLDLSPYSSANLDEASNAPAYQCICILSERPYSRFFSQCLQLLHAARLVNGGAALRLARAFMGFNGAPPGFYLPLRGLLSAKEIPGCLQLPREKLRVPHSVGLPLFDVPLSPLLNRLDVTALMMVYVAMLCERRILFVGQSLPTLTACVHAAAALLQPFEWQHIFIPVVPEHLLSYCAAPSPYIMGVTPAQFVSITDEDSPWGEVGEIFLVNLDEGYAATMNSSLPLVDLEGPTAHNNHTGFVALAAPKALMQTLGPDGIPTGLPLALAPPTATTGAPPGSPQATIGRNSSSNGRPPLGPGGLSSGAGAAPGTPHSGGGGGSGAGSAAYSTLETPTTAGAGSASSGGLPSPSTPSSSSSSSSSSAAAAAAAAALQIDDNNLTPFFCHNRSHTYDETFIKARQCRRLYAAKRLVARRKGREHIGNLFNRDDDIDISGDGSKWIAVVPDTELDGSFAEEIGTTTLGIDLKHLLTTPGNNDALRKRRKAAQQRVQVAAPEVKPDLAGLEECVASIMSGSLYDHQKTVSSTSSSSTMNLTQRLALKNMMKSFGFSGSSSSSSTGTGGSNNSSIGSNGIGPNAGSAGGASNAECPGARLAAELRRIYEKEKKEGGWDEAAVYAATLAFVAVVFGRVPDFVSLEPVNSSGGALHPQGAGSSSSSKVAPPWAPGAAGGLVGGGLEPRFNHEHFVRFSPRHSTVSRLLDEAQHTQSLQAFAVEQFTRQMNSTASSATTSQQLSASGSGAKVHFTDLIMAEAASCGALPAAVTGKAGPGTFGTKSGVGGPGALLGATLSYTAIHKKLLPLLQERVDFTFSDAAPGAYAHLQPMVINGNNGRQPLIVGTAGQSGGVGGSPFTVREVLSKLAYSAQCVTTVVAPQVPGAPPFPDVPFQMVVTALRALLSAATSATISPEESPSAIVQIAAAATHDPVLVHVVMGVIWARLNDAVEKNWQHGYKAAVLLLSLLKLGSPRVGSLAISFLPLLRFYISPTRVLAARAGYVAEEVGSFSATVYVASSASIVLKAKAKGLASMFGVGGSAGVSSSMQGLALSSAPNPLSSISPREGALMLARQAARVYHLLTSPRRWLLERAVALGPAAITLGYPLTLPYPYPLTPPQCPFAPGDCAIPYGWLPTPDQPAPPRALLIEMATSAEASATAATGGAAMPGGPPATPTGAQYQPTQSYQTPLQQGLITGPSGATQLMSPSGPATPTGGSVGSAAGGPMPFGSPPHPKVAAAILTVNRQARAADASWEQVHRVSSPCMASSYSRALATLPIKTGIAKPPPGVTSKEGLKDPFPVERPDYVKQLIKEARQKQALENPASYAASLAAASSSSSSTFNGRLPFSDSGAGKDDDHGSGGSSSHFPKPSDGFSAPVQFAAPASAPTTGAAAAASGPVRELKRNDSACYATWTLAQRPQSLADALRIKRVQYPSLITKRNSKTSASGGSGASTGSMPTLRNGGFSSFSSPAYSSGGAGGSSVGGSTSYPSSVGRDGGAAFVGLMSSQSSVSSAASSSLASTQSSLASNASFYRASPSQPQPQQPQAAGPVPVQTAPPPPPPSSDFDFASPSSTSGVAAAGVGRQYSHLHSASGAGKDDDSGSGNSNSNEDAASAASQVPIPAPGKRSLANAFLPLAEPEGQAAAAAAVAAAVAGQATPRSSTFGLVGGAISRSNSMRGPASLALPPAAAPVPPAPKPQSVPAPVPVVAAPVSAAASLPADTFDFFGSSATVASVPATAASVGAAKGKDDEEDRATPPPPPPRAAAPAPAPAPASASAAAVVAAPAVPVVGASKDPFAFGEDEEAAEGQAQPAPPQANPFAATGAPLPATPFDDDSAPDNEDAVTMMATTTAAAPASSGNAFDFDFAAGGSDEQAALAPFSPAPTSNAGSSASGASKDPFDLF